MAFAEIDKHSFFKSTDHSFNLFHGDAITIIPQLEREFEMVFADPPYFLSNNGHTIHNGQIVSVNKGSWDKLTAFDSVYAFNRQWISLVREKMKANATLWICEFSSFWRMVHFVAYNDSTSYKQASASQIDLVYY